MKKSLSFYDSKSVILLKVALNTITQTLLFFKYNLTVLPEYWLLVWLLLLTLNRKDKK
jgi:hypothetical protein